MRRLAAVLALALLAGACGDDEPDTDGGQVAEPTATTQTTGKASLPGEREEIAPHQGAKLAVAGVAAGDTLKVRSGPGTEFNVVLELRPTAMNAVATGHNRFRGEAGFWSEITVDGTTGWANTAFLLQPSHVKDITAEMFPKPSDRPTAKTMDELGKEIASDRAEDDLEADIVVVDAPAVGDLGEITVDITGLGDDSVGGERLKIFAEPNSRRDSFTVRSVEATTFCLRGVSQDGLCV